MKVKREWRKGADRNIEGSRGGRETGLERKAIEFSANLNDTQGFHFNSLAISEQFDVFTTHFFSSRFDLLHFFIKPTNDMFKNLIFQLF